MLPIHKYIMQLKNKFTKNKDGEYSPQIELFRSLRLYFLYSIYRFKLVHPQNAPIPIEVVALRILMLVKPMQFENANSPIEVIPLLGISMLVRLSQYANA